MSNLIQMRFFSSGEAGAVPSGDDQWAILGFPSPSEPAGCMAVKLSSLKAHSASLLANQTRLSLPVELHGADYLARHSYANISCANVPFWGTLQILTSLK